MTAREQVTVPGGMLWQRPELLDYTVVEEVVERDSYRLRDVELDGATVLDCGAHVGIFSTMCAHRGARAIIAVEPQPENLELLRLNAEAWPQIQVMGVAIGPTFGTTRIAGESGGGHIELDHPDSVEVEQVTLASLIDMLGNVDLLKLDMEGGEVDALLSTDHDRLARVQRIVMETHGPTMCPWVQRPRVGEVVEHLLPTHNIEANGFPTHLGMLFAQRNGCTYGW